MTILLKRDRLGIFEWRGIYLYPALMIAERRTCCFMSENFITIPKSFCM